MEDDPKIVYFPPGINVHEACALIPKSWNESMKHYRDVGKNMELRDIVQLIFDNESE